MTGFAKGHHAVTMSLTTEEATIATLVIGARAHAQDHQRMDDQNYHQHLDMTDDLLSQASIIHHPEIMITTIAVHHINTGITQVVKRKLRLNFLMMPGLCQKQT